MPRNRNSIDVSIEGTPTSKQGVKSLFKGLVTRKKSTRNSKTITDAPLPNEFILRWNHVAPPSQLLSLAAGTRVIGGEFIKERAFKDLGGIVIRNIVKVIVLGDNDEKREEGFVSAAYLEYRGTQHHMAAVKYIRTSIACSPAMLEGRWFLGRVSPIDAAIWLSNRSYLSRGSFVVCQPSFLWPKKGDWPRYLLVVRLLSGNIEWHHQTWYADEENNHHATELQEVGFEKRPTINDHLLPPPPNDPPPAVAYFVISRTVEGRYTIDGANSSFYLMPELLEFHMKEPLELAGSGRESVLLRESAQPLSSFIDGVGVELDILYRCPAPPTIPNVAYFNYTGRDALPSLVRYPGLTLKDIPSRVYADDRLARWDDSVSPSGSVYHGFMNLGEAWQEAKLRRLDSKHMCLAAAKTDLAKIDPNDRAKSREPKSREPTRLGASREATKLGASREATKLGASKEATRLGASREATRRRLEMSGFEYIAHILAADMPDPKSGFGPWVAYEFVSGLQLNALLVSRREECMPVPLRQRYEIMAQVAAGMRFLEVNSLCHRHLNGRNAIVQTESAYLFRVKITDYMLPWHFVNEQNAKVVDLMKITNEDSETAGTRDNTYLWWAPETLNVKMFDIVSDVWSFGCLMFEIMNDGELPYAFEKPEINKLPKLIKFVTAMQQMKLLPEDTMETFIHDLMGRCLHYDRRKRPTFTVLNQFFTDLLFNFKMDPISVIKKCLVKNEMVGSEATTC